MTKLPQWVVKPMPPLLVIVHFA